VTTAASARRSSRVSARSAPSALPTEPSAASSTSQPAPQLTAPASRRANVAPAKPAVPSRRATTRTTAKKESEAVAAPVSKRQSAASAGKAAAADATESAASKEAAIMQSSVQSIALPETAVLQPSTSASQTTNTEVVADTPQAAGIAEVPLASEPSSIPPQDENSVTGTGDAGAIASGSNSSGCNRCFGFQHLIIGCTGCKSSRQRAWYCKSCRFLLDTPSPLSRACKAYPSHGTSLKSSMLPPPVRTPTA
jgi:hypothetical protein